MLSKFLKQSRLGRTSSQLVRRSSRVSRINLLACNRGRFFSSDNEFDTVVIGGGPGGYSCAIRCAQLGMKTACIEGRGTLGGTCLNVGCIPSKALLHNSHLFHEAQHDFAKRGIMVDNVTMDVPTLMKAKESAVTGLTQGIEGLFKKNKVTYVKGWGKITGKNEVTATKLDNSGTETINAKNIVIATGSDSARIPGIEIDEQDIITSTGAIALSSVPEHLVVVGAGVIGLEMGSVWSRLGAKVTVVEFLDRIVPGVDGDVAKKFQKLLGKQGFQFKLSTGVKSVTKQGSGSLAIAVEDKKSGNIDTLEADKCLISIGRVPFTDGLGIEEQGIAMDGRQVAVDEQWRSTSHGNVFAIGDVIKGPMLAHKAEEEGIAVAEVLDGKHGHVDFNCIPSVIYTYPEVAVVGKTEEQLKEGGVEYKKGEFPFMANSRARTNMDSDGSVKILADKKTDRILGVHILGPNAGEMIAEACIAMEYGASCEDIARVTHSHPTLSEAFKEASMLAWIGKTIHF